MTGTAVILAPERADDAVQAARLYNLAEALADRGWTVETLSPERQVVADRLIVIARDGSPAEDVRREGLDRGVLGRTEDFAEVTLEWNDLDHVTLESDALELGAPFGAADLPDALETRMPRHGVETRAAALETPEPETAAANVMTQRSLIRSGDVLRVVAAAPDGPHLTRPDEAFDADAVLSADGFFAAALTAEGVVADALAPDEDDIARVRHHLGPLPEALVDPRLLAVELVQGSLRLIVATDSGTSEVFWSDGWMGPFPLADTASTGAVALVTGTLLLDATGRVTGAGGVESPFPRDLIASGIDAATRNGIAVLAAWSDHSRIVRVFAAAPSARGVRWQRADGAGGTAPAPVNGIGVVRDLGASAGGPELVLLSDGAPVGFTAGDDVIPGQERSRA